MSTINASRHMAHESEEPKESLIEELLRLLADPNTATTLEKLSRVEQEEERRRACNRRRREERSVTKAERQELLSQQKIDRREQEEVLLSVFPAMVEEVRPLVSDQER